MDAAKETRKFYLDVLRVIATILVLVNHLPAYTSYYHSETAPQAFGYLFLTMFSRINVPLFFMLSGSLLLSKEINYKALLLKRIPRFFAILVLASILQYFVYYFRFGIEYTYSFGILDFIAKFFSANVEFSYWFLYCYLGFLVMLPFLRRVSKEFTSTDAKYMVVFHILFSSVLPITNYVLTNFSFSPIYLTGYFSIPFMTEKAFFYPLLGYYLDHVVELNRITKNQLIGLFLLSITGIFVSSALTYHQGITTGYTEDFVQLFDYVTAIFVFVCVKFVFTKSSLSNNSNLFTKIVTWISGVSIGVYLFDITLKSTYNWLYSALGQPGDYVITVIWCFYSICICGGITYILKKMPILKTLL